jgi:hypothetical protein
MSEQPEKGTPRWVFILFAGLMITGTSSMVTMQGLQIAKVTEHVGDKIDRLSGDVSKIRTAVSVLTFRADNPACPSKGNMIAYDADVKDPEDTVKDSI